MLSFFPDCNRIIRAPSATITSPRYPKNYVPNIECLTKLRSDIISTYFIRFVYFRLEANHDSVKIYTGISDLLSFHP